MYAKRKYNTIRWSKNSCYGYDTFGWLTCFTNLPRVVCSDKQRGEPDTIGSDSVE